MHLLLNNPQHPPELLRFCLSRRRLPSYSKQTPATISEIPNAGLASNANDAAAPIRNTRPINAMQVAARNETSSMTAKTNAIPTM